MGRKPIHREAMTAAERQRRRRDRLRQGQGLVALRRAWEECTKSERTRFLRELRADQLKAKQERRAERERALGEKIRRENERRGYVEPPPGEPGKSCIVGWLAGLPIRRRTPRQGE